MEENLETIEIEVDAELLRQVEELIQPMGINMEQLIQMFFACLTSLQVKTGRDEKVPG